MIARSFYATGLILLAAKAEAQPPFRALDSIFTAIRTGQPTPAVGVAVVLRDSLIYTNIAGYADLERGTLATPRTRFDWASIAKQFTAFGVSQLLEQRSITSLSDDARRYIPELDIGGARITLAQLLHHTTGLEDTDGLYALSGGRNGDPVTHRDLVGLLVQQQHLRFAPGSAHFYSNGGYTLLAEIISRVTGVPFAAWADSAIFEPLGMHAAGFVDDPHQLIPDRALPFVRASQAHYRRSTSDLYPGAGGLFATVSDMATWMRFMLRGESPAVRRLQVRGTLSTGDTLPYAWGLVWSSYRGRKTLGHAGSGPATAAHMLTIPELGFGVVAAIAGDVQANPAALAFLAVDLALGDLLGPRDIAPTGRRMRLITEDEMKARPAESVGIVVDSATLQRYAGKYRMPDGSTLLVRARAATLEWAVNGRLPYIPLFPLPDAKFVSVPWWDTYRFELPQRGPATRLVREATPQSLRGPNASNEVGERLPDSRFSPATARPYVGVYYSDELNTAYEVVLDGEQLALRHARHGKLPLAHLEGERFAVSGGGIVGAHFARAGNAAVAMELEARSWGVRASFRRTTSIP
ncbi:MAG: serine hydrolase domain-containing protein [Gemmatimonadota bacterium]